MQPACVEFPVAEVGAAGVVRIGLLSRAIGQSAAPGVIVAAPEPICGIVLDEEGADIQIPVGLPGRAEVQPLGNRAPQRLPDRKSTRLNSSHLGISYAVFC